MPPKSDSVEPSSASRRGPTPKERGCFECSRRRIICDKAEPSCAKCIKKGIECSGVNRIRFTAGVARRGKLKDCKIPDISNNGIAHLPTTTGFAEVRWPEDRKKKKAKRKKDADDKAAQHTSSGKEPAKTNDETDTSSISPPEITEGLFDIPIHSVAPIDVSEPTLQLPYIQDATPVLEEDVEEIIRAENSMFEYHSTYNELQPWIAPMSSQARMLFSYFSEVVAPVMVVLDTTSNGYRNVVLSMALEDDVLQRAVGVVAAQHLSRDRPEIRDAAEAGRAAIISRLRKDALSASVDQVFSVYNWTTLIVLLVGETVTGSADYRFLVQMLITLAAHNTAGKSDSTTTRFLQTQTNMFEMISSPMIREDDGVLAIQRTFESWQDWLTCEQFPVGSEHHRIIDSIRLCFSAACTIYIRRATSDTSSPSSRMGPNDARQASTIRDLIGRLSMIPPHAPGAHALVWPCFVGGAETSDPNQRAFFVNYMNSIYAKTKFRNIPASIQSLENIWASKGEKRWTQSLPELSKVLVM